MNRISSIIRGFVGAFAFRELFACVLAQCRGISTPNFLLGSHPMTANVSVWPNRTPVLNWRQLVRCSDEQLARLDIAAVNLACAEGLPGVEQIDYGYCLYKLDDWADCVKEYTALLMPQFRRKRHEYENSEAYFRTLSLITVLQRDQGVRYNPAKIPEDAPFDTADSFIHGIIQGDGGTCTTMPVVYAAVGRRLGYPIKLVTTRGKTSGHMFARWDDARTGHRFNIEAAGQGLSTPTDDYFRTGLYELGPEVEADGCFLQSKTPRMELAGFLNNRAWRFEDVKNWRLCVEAWAWAYCLNPRNKLTLNSLKRAMIAWDQEQKRRKPVGFPMVWIRRQSRLYPEVPQELEGDIHGLGATENILSDPRLEEKYWGPMRRGGCQQVPSGAVATFLPDERCYIDLQFK
jgi:hypothetical protein